MPPDERRILEMVEAMRVEGGSFVKALAECFVHADPENRRRLLRAFPEYVETYLASDGNRRFAKPAATTLCGWKTGTVASGDEKTKNPGPGRVQS